MTWCPFNHRNSMRRRGIILAAVTAAAVFVNVPIFAHESDRAPTIDAWVAALEGGWSGNDNHTPFGPMPFALVFERQPDGSLRAFSAYHRTTWIELRFWQQGDGQWRLDEAASLENLGVQRHTLAPAGLVGTTRRFVTPDDPDFLSIDMAVDGDLLGLDVFLRGREHVRFRLARVPDESLPELREHLSRQAERDPREAGSLLDSLGRSGMPDASGEDRSEAISLDRARAEAAVRPTDARAQMTLARTLIEAIETDPVSAPYLAAELLATLQAAHALDPAWAAPYHGLIGYYLNAPPIAGGSVDKAIEMAERLAVIDPAASAEQLAAIERRHGAGVAGAVSR